MKVVDKRCCVETSPSAYTKRIVSAAEAVGHHHFALLPKNVEINAVLVRCEVDGYIAFVHCGCSLRFRKTC
jgi:hypothetical protein